MSRKTFMFVCNKLRKELEPQDNWVREPMPVEKKVAVALYKLASCGEYRVIANQFGIHKSTVHKCLYAFCNAVIKVLMPQYIKMPNNSEAVEVAKGFENMCGIPNVIGTIDGTHIPILPPTEGYRDFINRKNWPSYNVQAVVDYKYRFRDVTCKHPGCTHDAAVLKDSVLYQHPNRVLPTKSTIVNGMTVPYVLLGDPAYPLLPWLLKGYKERAGWPADEESFNVYLSRGRVVVENAFGRLKSRWRCLLKKLEIDYTFVPIVVVTCTVLHNIVEENKERFVDSWMNAVVEAETGLYPQPNERTTRELNSFEGSTIQNHLKSYMASHFPLRQSRMH